MSVTTGSIGTADIPASSPSLHGLDGVNFFLAALLAGFGPYVAAYLAEQKWTQADIGFVLTASSVAGLLSQVPSGELLDRVRSKRALVAVGVGIVILSALVIALRPSFLLVSIALVLQGMTGGFLGPAIAAISLGLVGYSALAERLGRNQRFASTGALVGAGLMGLVGYLLSYQAIFVVAAALGLPLFAALSWIRAADIHFGQSCGAPDHHGPEQPPRIRRRALWQDFSTARLFRVPIPIPTCQCLRPPARRRGVDTRVTNRLVAHHIGVDHRATDPCCTNGTLGRTTGTKLGSAPASAHRVRGFADPRTVFRFDQRSPASRWRSSARRHQCNGTRGAHSTGHCRYYQRDRAVQLGPRHRWNGFRNWRFT